MGRRDERITSDPRQSAGDEPALAHLAGTIESFADEYQRQEASTSPARRRVAIALAVLLSGPFAILGAFAGSLSTGGASVGILFYVVLIGPAVEEVVKAAGAMHLVERRPWLVPGARTLPAITVASALFFAAVENLLYLNVYIPDPSAQIATFRWIAGPLLHGSASLLVGIGVMRQYEVQRRRVQQRLPDDPDAAEAARWPWFVAGWALHGAWNLGVTVLSLGGWGVPTG